MSQNEQMCKGEHSGHICLLASQDKFDEIKEITKKDRSLIPLFKQMQALPPIEIYYLNLYKLCHDL